MKHTMIIAEAGVNYNGDLDLAKKMIYVAKESGADIIKFQTAKPELVMSKYAEKADYQKAMTGENESQLEMCRKILLPYDAFYALKKLCQELDIGFLSTPFELESIDFLHTLGIELWKIPSGEITNLPYLEKIGKMRQKVILSTGMSTLDEVQNAVDVLTSMGTEKNDIVLLHCTTEYPAPFDQVNLNAMLTLKNRLGMHVGYSDHTSGITVPIAAVALGAEIIEKHFTLDKNMIGPDHKASLAPDELKTMVKNIRIVEKTFGDGEKIPQSSELRNMQIARKSIVARRYIRKGETLTIENITTKRPGNGISPMMWYEILGSKAVKEFQEDELIVTQETYI
ncbi:MAG: N-acetylneuraminate synthase [Enterocloster sp.]